MGPWAKMVEVRPALTRQVTLVKEGTYTELQIYQRYSLGSGGGAPYPQDSEGNGSGIIMIYSNSIDATGAITANGANALLTAAEGSGGGGSAVSIYLVANAINTNNKVNATGGNGDKTAYDSYDGVGGNGGAGRIRISANSITGTSTPSAYTTGFDTEHNRKYASPNRPHLQAQNSRQTRPRLWCRYNPQQAQHTDQHQCQ